MRPNRAVVLKLGSVVPWGTPNRFRETARGCPRLQIVEPHTYALRSILAQDYEPCKHDKPLLQTPDKHQSESIKLLFLFHNTMIVLKIACGQKCFSYRGAKLWNDLNREHKMANTFTRFKSSLKNDKS